MEGTLLDIPSINKGYRPKFNKGIVLREKKGSELTFEEMDNNFKKLILMNVLLGSYRGKAPHSNRDISYIVGAFEYYPTFEQVVEYASVNPNGEKTIDVYGLRAYYMDNDVFTNGETFFVRMNGDDDLNGIHLSNGTFLGFITTAGFERVEGYGEDEEGPDYSTIGDKFLAVFQGIMES